MFSQCVCSILRVTSMSMPDASMAYMGMYFLGGFKVLEGTEVEAPRIIPPNHTPESSPMNCFL